MGEVARAAIVESAPLPGGPSGPSYHPWRADSGHRPTP